MKHELKNNNAYLVVPTKVVAGVIVGIMVVFLIYIYSNYFHATTSPPSRTDQTSDPISVWQPVETYAHIIFHRTDEITPSEDKKTISVAVDN